jgi:hypothetical protein
MCFVRVPMTSTYSPSVQKQGKSKKLLKVFENLPDPLDARAFLLHPESA